MAKFIFRYAEIIDVLLMMLGSIFGIVSGLALPLVILVYGYTLDEFASYDILQTILMIGNYSSTTSISNLQNFSALYFCDPRDIVIDRYFDSINIASTLKSEAQHFTYNTIGLAVIVFVSATLSRLIWAITGSRQAKKIRLKFFESVITRQLGWYDTHPISEMPAHLSDCIPRIEKAIGTHISSLVQDGITFVSCFVIALAINWELTLVTSVLVPIIFVIAIILSKITEKVSVKQTNTLATAGTVAVEVLTAIKTVVAFGGQEKEIQRYHSHLKVLKKQSLIVLALTSLTLSFLAMMILQYFALGFWYASRLYVECAIKPGEMLVVVTEVMLGTFTLAELLPELKEFTQAKGLSEEVFDIIDQESDINALSLDGEDIDDFQGNIEFSDVTFAYPARNDVQILHGLNLRINAGQTVALVGPTGCGKSTIMNLIPRLYEYNTGNILIDGKEIRTLNVNWLRTQIGIVSQEPVLFNVSIAENISYGKKNATKEEIEKAAKLANAHDFITKLPYKYETVVGEGGSQISGGQKQRIAIARALIRDPKILLLDEATSALDLESEKVIQAALDKAREGRTTIIIAHRLSTIRTADVIVSINEGRVVERGDHAELMEKQGLYYNLVMNQSSDETDGDSDDDDFADDMMKTSYMKQSSITSSLSGSSLMRQRSATVGGGVYYRAPRTGTMMSRAGGSLLREASINLEYALPAGGLPEGRTSVYAGFEDRNCCTSLVDAFTTIKDLLVLTLKWTHWLLLMVALIIFVMSGVFFTYNFYVLKELVEQFRHLDEDDLLDGVVDQTIQFASIGAVIFILYIIGVSAFGYVGEQVVEGAREKSFRAMVKQTQDWFDERQNSVSILTYNLITQAKDIFQLFDIRMGSSIRSFITTIGVVILSLYISWVIAFCVLPAYIFMFVGAFLQVALTKKYADKSSQGIEETAQVTTEYIENVSTVTMLSIEERLIQKYEKLLIEPANDNLKSAVTNGMLLGGTKGLVYFCIGISYIVGAHIFTSNSDEVYYADIAEIFTVIVILMLTSRMFKTAFNALPDVHKAFASASEVVFIVGQHVPDSFGQMLESVNGKIDFKTVHFSYSSSEKEVKVLRGLNISVEPGKTLAFVGPSGSGKSTAIALLEKFYKPSSGFISLDERNIRELRDSWLRQQISVVSQEPVLFDMSIADNIRYGANFRQVTDKEIQKAARAANIHEFIISLPEGYDTNVGSKGAQLSGGQKQRIAIARALVRNPKILLLDEATSALDAESERVVQEALDNAREGRTTIVVAHRLSTIQNADCIAVLHKGRVVEKGTHAELMNRRGRYHAMHSNHTRQM